MRRIVILITVLFISFVQAQKPTFWNDIQAFKKQDSIAPPAKNITLFVGSSSFTFWKDVQNDFPTVPIINRGFGGSTLEDVIYYQNEVIFAYQPKRIVIYCGENDIAGSGKVTSKQVFKRFKKLYKYIRKQFPDIPIVYISIKPSPSRWNMKQRMIQANLLISNFIAKKKNISFVNVWDKMLDENGNPQQYIFMEDNLHMNKKGYQIWINALQPYIN